MLKDACIAGFVSLFARFFSKKSITRPFISQSNKHFMYNVSRETFFSRHTFIFSPLFCFLLFFVLTHISLSSSFQFPLHFISSFFLFLPNSHPGSQETRIFSSFQLLSASFLTILREFSPIFAKFRTIHLNFSPILRHFCKNSISYLRFYRSPRFTRCTLFI